MNEQPQEFKKLFEQFKTTEALSPEEQAQIEEVIEGKDSIALVKELTEEEQSEPLPNSSKQSKAGSDDIRLNLAEMKLPEKVKLAMFGNSTCRTLLIRDNNRMVQQFVLKNPRIQVREIEDFAKNPHLSELILRTIAENSAWMKSYTVKYHMVSNPKTPIDIALKWLRHLHMTEVRRLSKSKNVSQVISVTARKRVMQEEGRK